MVYPKTRMKDDTFATKLMELKNQGYFDDAEEVRYHGQYKCVRGSRRHAEHIFYLYPPEKRLKDRRWDTHDCMAMCSNCAISKYQTSNVGIVHYVCLGHPV